MSAYIYNTYVYIYDTKVIYMHIYVYISSIAFYQLCGLAISHVTLIDFLYLIDEEIEAEGGIHLLLSHLPRKWQSGEF